MLSKVIYLALPLVALATPFVARQDNGNCTTGPLYCCQGSDLVSPKSPMGNTLLKLSGYDSHPEAYTGHIAATCNTGIGVLDGPACSAIPTCCHAGTSAVGIGCISIVL